MKISDQTTTFCEAFVGIEVQTNEFLRCRFNINTVITMLVSGILPFSPFYALLHARRLEDECNPFALPIGSEQVKSGCVSNSGF